MIVLDGTEHIEMRGTSVFVSPWWLAGNSAGANRAIHCLSRFMTRRSGAQTLLCRDALFRRVDLVVHGRAETPLASSQNLSSPWSDSTKARCSKVPRR